MTKLYVNPLPVRIWHWTNAFGFVLLILTGLQIRYVGQLDLLSFRTAVVAHNWIGFVLIANFFIWLGFYLFTDKIKVYHPELSPVKYFKASFRQMQYYGYGIFRGDPNPHHVGIYRKFNALQSMMYQIIMMLVVLGAASVPLVHMALRRAFRGVRERRAARAAVQNIGKTE